MLAGHGRTARLRHGVEIAIVVLLAVQAARLAWLLLPPAGLGTPVVDAPTFPLVDAGRLAIDAFHPQRGSAVRTDASGLHLFAVRPAQGGGSAILAQGDGPQRAYPIGEEVATGVRLAEVHADHVVLDSGGRRSELRFTRPVSGMAPRGTAAATPAAGPADATPAAASGTDITGPAVDPAQLLAQMGLRPDEQDGRIAGYTVVPRGDAGVLRQAGLQAGDVLLSVNNETLDPERYLQLGELLAGASTITLTYRRDGQVRSATLQAQTP